ncbi:hypothetical protein M3027_06765 [Geoalkalibacter halelectricus]|nr:hypothetical protein [Geoalkalibacter halelectricus]
MIVSRFSGALPAVGADRTIPGGPLYPAEEVLKLLKAGGGAVRVWTRKCAADVQQLALDPDDLIALVSEAVARGRFTGSEWCQQKPAGPWAACDAYALTRHEWVQASRKELAFDYYLKFAIGRTGTILLLVSCHLSL